MTTTLIYYSIDKDFFVATIVFFDDYLVATWLQKHNNKCSHVVSVASDYFRYINYSIEFKKKSIKKKNRHYLPPLPHYDRPCV
jgi:hypothetical protein